MSEIQYTVQDNDDLEVTMRILDVLRACGVDEGVWDGAAEYILDGGDRSAWLP